VLQVAGLSKKFTRTVPVKGGRKKRREEFFAVDDVSFDLKPGEILGIIGPNGAGKTTLLRMLGGIMTPTAGTVTLLGRTFAQDPNAYRRAIGYLSGNTKLYGRLTPWELLFIFADLYGIPRPVARARTEEIIRALQIAEFAHNRIETLSTGQTQRVSIARCLIHAPEVYIFDEPTLGLDVLSSYAIIRFMQSEGARGKGVVYSTHYMEEAEDICTRIILIHKGSVIAQGSPEELRRATGAANIRQAFIALLRERGECIDQF